MLSLPRHQPLLYLISNRLAFLRNPGIDGNTAWRLQIKAIRRASAVGCHLVQIRERDLSARMLLEFTRQAIASARPYGTKVLVNDRLDVALSANADGVHLRVSSLPAKDVRRVVEKRLNEFLIGVSTHSLSEAQAAELGGADFVVCGPVYDTPSKRQYGEPLGAERFAQICRAVEIPTLALGGITLDNFHQPLQAGAAGIAAIGLFNDLKNLRQITETITQSGYGSR